MLRHDTTTPKAHTISMFVQPVVRHPTNAITVLVNVQQYIQSAHTAAPVIQQSQHLQVSCLLLLSTYWSTYDEAYLFDIYL